MALTRPVLNQIGAFDATKQQVFTFIVPAGGDQVVANRLIVEKVSDGSQILSEKVTTFAYSHTLEANKLTNGYQYNAYIVTYNSAGDESEKSLPLQFWCHSAPTFEITNIPTGGVISNNSYSFELKYNQSDEPVTGTIIKERLNGYVYTLYDDEHIQIATSGEKYVDSDPPNTFYYIFDGFTDKQTYYIQATGQTVDGTNIATPEYQFTINFVQPSIYTQLTLTSNCQGGYVTISSSMLSIDGSSNPEPPIYIDNDTAVDVRGDGKYVAWLQGYEIGGDFEAQFWGKAFEPGIIMQMEDSSGNTIKVAYHITGTTAYYDLTATTLVNTYYIMSSTFPKPNDTANVTVRIRRLNGLYSIEIDGV